MDPLILLVIVLLVLWLMGFSFHIGGSIIHALLVVALVLFLVRYLSNRSI